MSKEGRSKKKGYNQRYFMRLIRSFGAMLLIPIILALINYFWFKNVLVDETVRYEQALLKQAQTAIDEKLQGIQLYAFALSQNEEIIDFLENHTTQQGDLLIKVERVRKQLSSYVAQYPCVKSVVVYSTNQNIGVSATSACFEAWPQAAVKLLRGNTDDWKTEDFSEVEEKIIEYLKTENLYCHYVDFQDSSGEQRVVLIHSLPIWSSGISYEGVLIAEIDMDQLLRNSGSFVEMAGGAFGIRNKEGEFVADIGTKDLFEQISELLLNEKNNAKYESHYIAALKKSVINDWKYIMIQPDDSFLKKLRQNRNVTLLLLMACLGVGVFFAYTLSKSNYRPMRNIMEKLRVKSVYNEEGNGDEYQYIERTIDQMEESVHTVQALIERQMPKIQSSMLQSLLANTITDYEEFQCRLKECGISYTAVSYIVAILHIQQFPIEQLDKQAFLKEILFELLKETIGKQFMYNIVEFPDDSLTLIINGDSEKIKVEVQRVLTIFMNRARKELQMLLIIAVGDPVRRLEDIPKMHQETKIILEKQQGWEEFGSILTTERKEEFQLYYCPAEIRNKISSYVMVGKEDLACQVLEENYHENFDNREVSHAVAISYFIMLIDTILSGCSVSEEEKQHLWDEYNPVVALLAEETPASMLLIVKGFAQIVGHYVHQRTEKHTDSMKYKILDFIQKEYSNNDLSLSYVADHFYITPNYLSTFFKEQVGDTFLNYLTEFRIQKAKTMLRETEDAINVIAKKVGYASANTFIRTFKKIEKMTPGEYRECSKTR